MPLVDRRADQLKVISAKLLDAKTAAESLRIRNEMHKLEKLLEKEARELRAYSRGWIFVIPQVAHPPEVGVLKGAGSWVFSE